jgi:hypothetical protein
MVRHLSTGTAMIVALMAAHRLAHDRSHGSRTLGDYFRQEASHIDDCPRKFVGLGTHCEQTTTESDASSRMVI